MKTALTAVVLIAMLSGAGLAEDRPPRTITTRDGRKYELAIITGTDANNITILYNAGTARISLENLPADIQNEVGYVTNAQQAINALNASNLNLQQAKLAEIWDKAAKKWIAIPQFSETNLRFKPVNELYYPPEAKENAAAYNALIDKLNNMQGAEHAEEIAETKRQLAGKLAELKIQKQTQANSFLGMSESDIITHCGKPISAKEGHDKDDGDYTIMVLNDTKGNETVFSVRNGRVIGGTYMGYTIVNLASKKIDDYKAGQH